MIKREETLKLLKLKPKTVITISVFIFIIMFVSAYYEVTESKKEIFHLLSQNASSLVETILLSSHNTLNSSYEIEDVMAERLLDNARLIKNMDSLKQLSSADLKKISSENDLYKIVLIYKGGSCKCTESSKDLGDKSNFISDNLFEQIRPILNGEETEMVLGMQKSKEMEAQRYAVAVARSFNRGAILIYLDANDFLNFRKKIGIGKLLQEIGKNPGIEYIVLQDTLGILSAGKSVDSINSVLSDTALLSALYNDAGKMRVYNYNGRTVFEAIKRLYHDNEIIGIFRIGLSLDDLRASEERTTNRIIVLSVILGLFSIVVLSIIFTSQNLKLLTRDFSKYKSFTGSILENLGEAVIVINNKHEIVLFNRYAELLFGIDSDSVIGKDFHSLISGSLNTVFEKIKDDDFETGDFETSLIIKMKQMFLMINVKRNRDEQKNPDGYSFVIRDLTEKKRLEDLSMRNEKLSAMGELASGVAHEIRNPINAIGMIAQRLYKEFSPKSDDDEYFNILTVLKSEVGRVNKIVTQFLNYSKPMELKLAEVDFEEFIKKVLDIFGSHAKHKNIEVWLKNNAVIKLKLDEELMIQALLNLLNNAYDAVENGGEIEIDCKTNDKYLLIKIADNGIGIPEEKQSKIFNLYYTSKKEGNGLGLSITQKIISQHNGEISFTSKENSGSIFTIKIPIV